MANSLLFLDGRAMRFGEITVVCCRTSSTPRLWVCAKQLTALQARSFLSCWPFSIAPPHGALSHPLAALFSVPCELSSGKTRTSSTAWGVHWMHEPFGVGVRWAVRMRSRPLPYLPEDAQ